MTKRIEITESVKKAIRNVVGDDIDYSNIVVYEASAASTRPIDQSSSVYHKSVMSRGFLVQMAGYIPNNPVTLQVMHQNEFLPVGKVFAADVYDVEQGHSELNVLFYLEKSSEYVTPIDLAIIDEVSVGAMPKHAYCSECGFDFRSSYYAMMYGECDNGHNIGEDGCHLRLTDLEKWSELSLVNRGASDKPKILTSAKQRLGKEEVQRLAASGSSADAFYLFASAAKNPPSKLETEEPTMDPKTIMELSSANGRLEANNETLKSKLELAEQTVSKKDLEIKGLQDTVKELKANDSTAKVEGLELKLSKSEEKLNAAAAVLQPQYKLACTAASLEFKDDADLDEMCSAIDKAGIKLAAVPRQQKTQDPESDPAETQFRDNSTANHAFVTK